MASAKIKGHLSMLMANVLWGLMSPVAKFVLSSGIIAPLLLTDFRVSGAALLFWILSLFMPYERVPWQDLLRLAGKSAPAHHLGRCRQSHCSRPT